MGFYEWDGMDGYEKRWSIPNEEGCGFGLVDWTGRVDGCEDIGSST